MKQIWSRKPVSDLQAEALESEKGLKRTLGAPSLVALGIGAIGCAFAGLCYAELASMLPIAGSAYTYTYATMGELIAWIIGWDLTLEYALGAATVSIAWSEYLNKLLGIFGVQVPYAFCHSPFQ